MEQGDIPEESALSEQLAEDAVPSCPHCLAEVTTEQYYCHRCAYPTGQLTGLLPFVNIRFEALYIGGVWRTIWYGRGASVAWRACLLLVLVLLCLSDVGLLLMFIVGLPFVIWDKLRGSDGADTEPGEDGGPGQE